MRAGRSLFDWLIDGLALVAAALLVLITVLIVLDVGGRSLRLFSLSWVLEATEYMLYGITFFGAPWLLREQGHIAIEIVVERLSATARRRARRLSDVLGALICATLFVYACRTLWSSYASGVLVQKSFTFPEWYSYAIVPPVMLLLLGVYVRWLAQPEPPAPPAGAGV
jgi:TRAP-type C4-dicarboxylate transport system permease small subunit